jgi:hypothetical protein
MKGWWRVCGPIRLSTPARFATFRTSRRRAVAVEALPVGSGEDRSVTSPADGEIDRPGGTRRQRDGDDLAQHRQGAMSPLQTTGFDVRPRGFRTELLVAPMTPSDPRAPLREAIVVVMRGRAGGGGSTGVAA